MTLRLSLFCLLAALFLIAGCTRSPDETSIRAGGESSHLDCILLLHQLLSEEQHLSKLLLIKKESDALEELVKSISKTAAEHVPTLENMVVQMGKQSGALVLPPGETATRKAIAKTKQDALLAASGVEFEFEVLLTQVEALNYGTHLALVASNHAPNPERAAQLLRMRTDLLDLHRDVTRHLRATAKRLADGPDRRE
ncbi:MAG TPA: hypothetical protein VEH04_10835 [Verrucomicrobiae bacterium]|nr:hypothetical protein [Verrucomicrobiae bacterium]